MNKVIIMILLLIIPLLNLNSQSISVDRIEKDGKHQIMTNTKDFFVDGRNYSFGMKVFETETKIDWLLLISSKYNISNSSEVLLKLENDEILYLPVNNVHIAKIKKPAYGITFGNVTTFHPEKEVDYYYSSVYVLNESDMDKIDTYGIKKIRISDGVKMRDKTYTNNPLGKYLTKCRKIIIKRLENPKNYQNLFDNF